MRFPSLRPTAARLSFGWFEGFPTRRFALYSLYTLVVFAVFVVVNFPYRVLVERLLDQVNEGPVQLGVQDSRFAWWDGLELRGVSLTDRNSGGQFPLLEVGRLYVRPGLEGLLRGRVSSVNLKGALYGGRVGASWAGGEEMNRASIQFRGLQLAWYKPLASLLAEGQIAGSLSGAISVESPPGGLRAARAAGEVELRSASLTDAVLALDESSAAAAMLGPWKEMTLPNLSFETAALQFTLQGERLQLEEFHAQGPELKVSGSGQIAIRNPLPDSVLNLRVTILPGADSPPAIRGLLALVPRPKGARPDAPLTITGTLRKPRLH